MRIESLLIERYGIHSDKRFDFAPGLQVIYGPNEAGKTTLLQLIRDLFFGYAHQHLYRFDEHTGPLKATAWCQTQGSLKFWFSRQKGRPDQISGEIAGSRETMDADQLDRMIGRISSTTYQQVFAFSLNELRQGGAVLQEEGLKGALFGAGMGGLPQLQSLQKRVQSEQQNLFNPHAAAKKQVINDLLIQIQKAREAHKQSTLRPHEYSRQLDGLKDQQDQAMVLRGRLNDLGQEQSRLTRYKQALPIQRECAVLRASLLDLPQKGDYPADAAEQFQKLNDRKSQLEVELAAIQEEQPLENESATSELVDERILKVAADIRTLRGRHEELVSQADEQSTLADRIETARRALRDQSQHLPEAWSPERLATLHPAPQDVEMLERIEKEASQLRQSLKGLDDRHSELLEKSESLNRLLEAAPDDARLPALEALLEGREDDWKTRNLLKDLQKRIGELCDQLDESLHTLASGTGWKKQPPEDVESVLGLDAPLASAVAEFARGWQERDARRVELRATLERWDIELLKATQQLAELNRQRDIPDAARLESLRQTRDTEWQALKQQLIGKDSLPAPTAMAQSLTEFEQSVKEADAQADELLKCADDVAHLDRLRADVTRLQQSRDQAAGMLASTDRDWEIFEQRWMDLWQPSGVQPHPPAVMQEWLQRLQEFRELHVELLDCEREELEIESEVAGPQCELTRAFPQAANIDDAWRRAQQLRDKLREQQSNRVGWLAELHQVSQKQSTVEQQRYETSLKLADCEQRQIAITQRYDLPTEWDGDMSRKALQGLFDAAHRQQEVRDLEAFLTGHEQGWQRFRGQFNPLIERVAPELASRSGADALAELESRLQSAEERVAHRRQLAERQTHAERDRLECLRKLQEIADQQTQLAADCGVTPGKLEGFITQVLEAREISRQIAARTGQLVTLLQPGETEESLADLNLDDIEGRLLTIPDDIRRCQEEIDAAQQRLGVLQDQLQKLELDEAPLRTAAELADLYARLESAVDQWAPLALADSLMTAARERFEQQHQPRLMADVERIFSRMTAGEYQEIVCSLDQNETNPLTVRHRSEQLKTPSQLSTGTAEQLYLAIRLAYVADYARLSEPMPMVMDDVLVNFDEQRARETLELLCELAESSQILFLTCHRRTVDLLHQLRPQSSIIELNGSLGTLGVEDVTSSHESDNREASKPPRRSKRRVDRPDQPVLFPPSN